MISSVANKKVKQVIAWKTKSKERKKDKIFLVEGLKMFMEAPTGWVVEAYATEAFLEKNKSPELQSRLSGIDLEVVGEEVFSKISDTQTPQGILAVLRQPAYDLEALLQTQNPLFVILENLQDPGNLGTIMRTSEGAGVTAVIMTENTVDLFNPKTIRSTMGSIYRVPFLYVKDMPEVLERLHQRGVTSYAAHLKGDTYYQAQRFQGPTAFLIGNEGNGLTRELADLSKSYIKIPMEGQLESLNAAVATAVLIYEAHRQRNL